MKISLNTQIFLGAVLGVAFGVLLGHTAPPSQTSSALLGCFNLLGKIFINLLKIIVFPLVFSAITAGIANLKNSPHAGRVWPALICYSAITTALAAATGLTAMNFIKPGVGLDIRLFQLPPMTTPHHPAVSLNNILGVVLLAIILGIVIGQSILKAVNKLFEITMTMVRWIMYLAPAGIMGLLTVLIAHTKIQLLYVLGKYILVVVGATIFHGIVTLPLILRLITGISPWKFFLSLKEAFITAFSTSSSTATLPVSLRCVTDNLKIDQSIARFVLPVGATLNMDGTAMYEAMAALFVANLCGVHLTLPAQMVVALTAMMASIGAPGIPSAGMVTMIMVLQSVGLPAGAVAILIPIDRPLDTIRTVVNVEGDCIGACVVQKIVKG